jgi:GNAT superfamily N-acetyltransferase
VIAEEQAYFGSLGKVEWKVFAHDQPPDLRQRLVDHGFEVEEPEAVMVLDLAETPKLDTSTLPGDVKMERLENAAQLKDVQQIEETVWEEDFGWLTQNLATDLAEPGYLSVYAAYMDEQPACAGWIYFHPNGQFADLWGGSTLPEYRGRGLYTALLDARIQEAAGRDYRFLTIDASPMSRPIVAKYGFRLLTTAWACNWAEGRTPG